MTKTAHRLAVVLLTAALVPFFNEATAQSSEAYPVKPIRIIVPNTPGGSIDIAARLVGPTLSEVLGQPIIIENRVGAGGVIGTNLAARAAPDGHTLIMVFDSFATNPYLYSSVQYDPVRDFAPIVMVCRSPQLLVTHRNMGVNTFKEFLLLARSKGSALDFATAGAGSSSRLSLELFKRRTGIDPTAVHFKGGGEAVSELLGGQVQVMLVTLGMVSKHVENGRLVPLAASSVKRIAAFPNVPTINEFYPGFQVYSWVGLLAPAATPNPIIEKLNAVMLKALSQPSVRDKFHGLGFEVVAGTPEAFSDLIREETAKWGDVIRRLKITSD